MKKRTSLLTILMVAVSVLLTNSGAVFAAADKKKCKKPRFYQFKPVPSSPPPVLSPGSQIEFRASRWTEPGTVELTIKKKKVDVELENRNIFYIYRATIPEELAGMYARISINGKSKPIFGSCNKRDGWLIKISEAGSTETENVDEGSDTEKGSDVEDKKDANTAKTKSP